MNLLKYFIPKEDANNNSVQEMAAKFEELTERYFEALKYYCPDCKRGFDRPIGKKTHMRLKHPTYSGQ